MDRSSNCPSQAQGRQPGLERTHVQLDATVPAPLLFWVPPPCTADTHLWDHRGATGLRDSPCQPLFTSPGLKPLISSFFCAPHWSFRSLFHRPFLSLVFRLPFLPPSELNLQLQSLPPIWAPTERWLPPEPVGEASTSSPGSDAHTWTQLQDIRQIFLFFFFKSGAVP